MSDASCLQLHDYLTKFIHMGEGGFACILCVCVCVCVCVCACACACSVNLSQSACVTVCVFVLMAHYNACPRRFVHTCTCMYFSGETENAKYRTIHCSWPTFGTLWGVWKCGI